MTTKQAVGFWVLVTAAAIGTSMTVTGLAHAAPPSVGPVLVWKQQMMLHSADERISGYLMYRGFSTGERVLTLYLADMPVGDYKVWFNEHSFGEVAIASAGDAKFEWTTENRPGTFKMPEEIPITFREGDVIRIADLLAGVYPGLRE
ncbi:MAG: hypothetical protein HRU75_03515 [Planctomycetia bacterium]|nr:MAG: hypothetical protein HRU75_03515 [Planctomycetia bacterium]